MQHGTYILVGSESGLHCSGLKSPDLRVQLDLICVVWFDPFNDFYTSLHKVSLCKSLELELLCAVASHSGCKQQ